MGRPRKNQESSEIPATERVPAPETVYQPPVYVPPPPMAPRQKQVERQGARSEPYTARHPQVRGGICDFCGVLDPNVPSQYQYKLCPHYRGMQLMCSYCPEAKDVDAVNYAAILNIHDSPDGNTLVVVCDSYECSNAHLKRFQLNRN